MKQQLAALLMNLDLPRKLGVEELRFFSSELRHQGQEARQQGTLPTSARQLYEQLLERAFRA